MVFIPTINADTDDVQIDKPLLEQTLANLKEGSTVKIRVYATNGAESLYTVTFVADKHGFTPSQMSEYMNKKSGFLGVSGVGSDNRDIQEAANNGNQ